MSKLRFSLLLLFLAFTSNSQAQQSTETKHEIWPEIDLFVPLNEQFRLMISASSEKASESKAGLEAQVGGYLDYFFKNRVTLRAGYSYRFSEDESDPYHEHRVSTDQSFHKPLAHDFVFSD